MTENLALELANTRITVNSMSPGSIHTRMWGRCGTWLGPSAAPPPASGTHRLPRAKGRPSGGRRNWRSSRGSDHCGVLSGRLIRVFADRFEEFPGRVDEIMASELLLRLIDYVSGMLAAGVVGIRHGYSVENRVFG